MIRNRIKTMVSEVNLNGGWTVVGWHRNGLITEGTGAGEEAMESHRTEGHIVCLEPTDPACLDRDSHKDSLIASIEATIPQQPDQQSD